MSGIIGKKIGMTSIYSEEDGKAITVTLVAAGPCVVTHVKTLANDGYEAVQLGFGEKKAKHTTSSLKGHFEKAKTTPKAKLVEFKSFEKAVQLGDVLTLADVFEEGDYVDAVGTSKGKGFQGVVKRHGFAGVGGQTHGQHNRARHPGSIGACSFPARVFKGTKMGGRTGNQRTKVQNLRVVKVLSEKNLLLVSGSIPGAINSYVVLEK